MILSTTFRVLSMMVQAYLIVVVVRILLSWFGNALQFPGMNFIFRITDPFLNIFRHIRWLRLGIFDLSVLLGFWLLNYFVTLFNNWAAYGISLNFSLALLVAIFFRGVATIIGFVGLFTLIRIVGLFLRASSVQELWWRMDTYLQPVVLRFIKFFAPHSSIPYGTALGIFFAACFIAGIGVQLGGNVLFKLIMTVIPF